MDSKEGDTLPFFLQKLWQIVCDQQTDHLISWAEDGRSFFVIQPESFSHEVLPQYFKHRNFSSFVRQLNMYGFHKIVATENGLSSSGEEIGFSHPHFIQDRPEELDQIKRKVNPRNTQLVQQAATMSKDDLDTMVKSLHELKNRQDQVVSALSSLTRDKDGLWSEVLTLRQQVTRQDAVIKKLLGFIGQCVTQGSLPLKRPHLAITEMDEVEGSQYKMGSMSSPAMSQQQPPQMQQQQAQYGSTSSIGQASSMTSASPEDMFVRPSKVVLSDETDNMDDLGFILSPGTMSELLPNMSAPDQANFATAVTTSATSNLPAPVTSLATATPAPALTSDAGRGEGQCPSEAFGIPTLTEGLNPKCIKSCESHIDHVGVGLDGVQKYLSNTLGTTAVDQLFDANDVLGGDLSDPFHGGVGPDPFTGVPISSPPGISTATASHVQHP